MHVFELELDASVAERVDLSAITNLVLTHLHSTMRVDCARAAWVPIVMRRREWGRPHDVAAVAHSYYLPADYAGLDQRRITLVDVDHDMLGDGSVRLLLTPGHTGTAVPSYCPRSTPAS